MELFKLALMIFGFFVLITIIKIVVYRILNLKTQENFPYIKRSSVMSKSELLFLKTLEEVIDNKFLILSKIRIADVLKVDKTGQYQVKYFNKITMKHVDFLICDKETAKPLLAIELDGSSHLLNSRIKRDLFVDNAFESAGLRLVHIQSSKSYDKNKLNEIFFDKEKPPARYHV